MKKCNVFIEIILYFIVSFLKVLVLQCCQGEDEPTQVVDVTLSDGLLQSDPDPSPGGENMPPDSHVVLKRANTVVITATPRGFMARRNHLIPHLAAEIMKSDGKTCFNTMHIRTADGMAKHQHLEYKAQVPQINHQLQKQLILPPARSRLSIASTDSGMGSTEQVGISAHVCKYRLFCNYLTVIVSKDEEIK